MTHVHSYIGTKESEEVLYSYTCNVRNKTNHINSVLLKVHRQKRKTMMGCFEQRLLSASDKLSPYGNPLGFVLAVRWAA